MSSLTPKLREAFAEGYNRIRSGELKTLIPYLCLFRLNGKPMNLRLHYQLAPMYATVQPSHSVYMLARQLGKSYSGCSSMELRNMLIPFYHTVLVQPRADQIQRLVSTVYKPLLNSCQIVDEFISSNERTKLALREFRNGSMCYAEHMFDSADRIRGISGAASVHVDECLFSEEFAFTLNKTTLGVERKKISEILAGDIVVSFDFFRNDAIVYSVVQRDASYRGTRNCFKITTQSGKTLICTAGHALHTNHGKMRLEDIVLYERNHRTGQGNRNERTPDQCRNGQPFGGCDIRSSEWSRCAHPLESLIEADGVRPVQIPDIARVRHETTVHQTESGIRRILGNLDAEIPWSISLLTCDDAPERIQAEVHSMGLSDGNDTPDCSGLVVHGRRASREGMQSCQHSNERIHTGRSGATLQLAERGLADSSMAKTSETQLHWENGMDLVSSSGRLCSSLRTGCSICPGVHEVQADTCLHDLPGVWGTDATLEQTVLFSEMRGDTQQDGQASVLRAEQDPLIPGVQGMETCAPRADQCGSPSPVCATDSRAEESSERIHQDVASPEGGRVPGASQSLQGRHEERPGIPAQTQRRESAILCQAEAGSGTVCEAPRKGQGTQPYRILQGAQSGISPETPYGETRGEPGGTGAVSETQGASGETGEHDRDRTSGLQQCQKSRLLPEEAGEHDTRRARKVPGETERTIQYQLGEQDAGTTCQDQSRTEKNARQLDARDQSQESRSEEAVLRAQDGRDQGGSGEVCSLSPESQGILSAQEGKTSSVCTESDTGVHLLTSIPVDFHWDPISSIEYVGELPVYDIEVEGTHSYILANGICSYNCQDVEYEYLDIAAEVMSASLFWGFSIYTGTPKTTDTTLGLLWERSSQAEWVIKCTHCGHYNVPNPENDLVKMIGKHGAICAKCGKDVSPINGGYVHSFPERMLSFPGYHISQTIHPLHLLSQHKWNQLLAKVEKYNEQTLYNEVFGWPYDASVSPLTMSDMQKATFTPKDEYGNEIDVQSPDDVLRVRWQYSFITVGVDWSGGGMVSDSYTAYAVLGLRRDGGAVDVLYGKRIPKGLTPTQEADEVMHWLAGTQADAFAYDNHGAGFTRLEIMKHQGLHNLHNLKYIVPIDYVRPHSGDVMQRRDADREPDMYYFNLDKSRSLAICVQAIKANRIRFRPFAPDDDKAYQRDFLALREDPRVSLGNETVILIIKKPGVPDDFAHAVNFGCSQIWDHFGAYPAIGSRYDASILDFDENHNRIMPDEQFGPRGDWERFSDAVNLRASIVESDMPY